MNSPTEKPKSPLVPDLDRAQYARVKQRFAELMELPSAARSQALAAIDDDPAVVAELERLLAHATATLDCEPLHRALKGVVGAAGPGDTLGAWTLDEEIGAGGMGKVFRAHRSDGHFHQQSAIKLLGGVPSAAALRFLARERQILASLTHPNIARLLDGGSTPGGQPYLVMEFVDGLPLVAYCREHTLATPARLRLLAEICAAVSFAHQQLVVHCDLKPGNILVTRDGRPMLLDFGISRLVGDSDGRTLDRDAISSKAASTTSTGIGYTPRYASPEQKAGQRVGTATDVYSLGLVMAELLEVPWPDGGQPDIRALPDELGAIIQLATRPDPEQRYASAEHLAADLRRYLAHEAVQAKPATPTYRLRKWLRRYWLQAGAATAFLALLTGFSWQMRLERDSAQAAERAERAVRDYMVAVFQGADPELAGRRDLPVSQILDAGRARLKETLQDQPATRAEMATILGSVYQNIGRRQTAVELFDEAIRLARQENLPVLLADAVQRKAYSLYDMEDFAAALPVAREALALRASEAPGSSAHLASLRLLGLVLSLSGDEKQAEPPLREALALANQHHGEASVEAALAQLAFARHCGAWGGRASEVLKHATAAGEIFARELGADHFRVADALEIRILGLAQDGRAAEAVDDAQQLVERRRSIYGQVSNPHSYALHVLGSVLRRAGRHLDAVPAFGASLAIHEELEGGDSEALKVPLWALALTLEEAGHHAEALAQFERYLRIQLAHPENVAESILELRLRIARNQHWAGQVAEAEGALQSIAREAGAEPSADAEMQVAAQLELAAVARARGDFDAALRWLEATGAQDDPQWHAERGRLALAQRDLARAGEAFDRAIALESARDGEDAPAVWLLKVDKARWLAASGQRADAASLAAAIRQRLSPMIHPQGRWAMELAAIDAGD